MRQIGNKIATQTYKKKKKERKRKKESKTGERGEERWGGGENQKRRMRMKTVLGEN